MYIEDMKHYTKHYVYELINLLGTVEYVGETRNPKDRMRMHTKVKPGPGCGKFYGRQDIIMNIVAEFGTRREAWKYQCKLQKGYGMETDAEKTGGKGGKIGGGKNKKLTQSDAEEIRRIYIKGDKEFGQKPLARRYGVDHSVIHLIIHNITYRS